MPWPVTVELRSKASWGWIPWPWVYLVSLKAADTGCVTARVQQLQSPLPSPLCSDLHRSCLFLLLCKVEALKIRNCLISSLDLLCRILQLLIMVLELIVWVVWFCPSACFLGTAFLIPVLDWILCFPVCTCFSWPCILHRNDRTVCLSQKFHSAFKTHVDISVAEVWWALFDQDKGRPNQRQLLQQWFFSSFFCFSY